MPDIWRYRTVAFGGGQATWPESDQTADLALALTPALHRPPPQHPIQRFGWRAEAVLQLGVFDGGEDLGETGAGVVAGDDEVGAGDQRRGFCTG